MKQSRVPGVHNENHAIFFFLSISDGFGLRSPVSQKSFFQTKGATSILARVERKRKKHVQNYSRDRILRNGNYYNHLMAGFGTLPRVTLYLTDEKTFVGDFFITQRSLPHHHFSG